MIYLLDSVRLGEWTYIILQSLNKRGPEEEEYIIILLRYNCCFLKQAYICSECIKNELPLHQTKGLFHVCLDITKEGLSYFAKSSLKIFYVLFLGALLNTLFFLYLFDPLLLPQSGRSGVCSKTTKKIALSRVQISARRLPSQTKKSWIPFSRPSYLP